MRRCEAHNAVGRTSASYTAMIFADTLRSLPDLDPVITQAQQALLPLSPCLPFSLLSPSFPSGAENSLRVSINAHAILAQEADQGDV